MQLTKWILHQKFDEYNKLYFDVKLGSCQFSFLNKSNSAYGRYDRRNTTDGKEISRICLGRCITWNEERLREILLHEMIHMYVETVEKKHFDGLFGHGWRFRRQCRRLKRDYGLRVRVHPHYERINKKVEPDYDYFTELFK
ncbi:MAG: SprT-like domain-containing protein [Muribaculaceae bacterium]|nr:SprT-like domain-containing protein [Muribaculaceae bacterium]